MMRFLLTVALAVALMTGSAKADPYQEPYTTMGSGTLSCGTWTAQRHGPDYVQNWQWIMGFLSGVGWVHLEGLNPLDGLDAAAISAWVDNYCQAHPLEHMATAGEAFTYAHPRRR